MNNPVRDPKNKNPYDLSAIRWVCKNCGGTVPPNSAYELRKIGEKQCDCKNKKLKYE